VNLQSFSVLGYLLLVAVLLALVFLHSIIALGSAFLFVQGMAAALMLWARFTFGLRSFHASADPTEGGLVTTGPYRFIRHPIYASILYFIWAAVLSHLSVLTISLAIVACCGAAIRILAEEALVRVRYPEYSDYARRTKRVLPFIL
jgi:protein-S-isoprenylcysteine O-methyltransferase Ste14